MLHFHGCFIRGSWVSHGWFTDDPCMCHEWNNYVLFVLNFQIYTETENEAYDLVKHGKAWAAFYFTANYSSAYKTKVFDQGYSEDWTVDNSEIKVRWDGTSKIPPTTLLRRS